MIRFEKKNYLYKIYTWLPIIILFISVLNEFDLVKVREVFPDAWRCEYGK